MAHEDGAAHVVAALLLETASTGKEGTSIRVRLLTPQRENYGDTLERTLCVCIGMAHNRMRCPKGSGLVVPVSGLTGGFARTEQDLDRALLPRRLG